MRGGVKEVQVHNTGTGRGGGQDNDKNCCRVGNRHDRSRAKEGNDGDGRQTLFI